MSKGTLKPRDESAVDFDLWSWGVIGLIYCGLLIGLWAPFIWQIVHG